MLLPIDPLWERIPSFRGSTGPPGPRVSPSVPFLVMRFPFDIALCHQVFPGSLLCLEASLCIVLRVTVSGPQPLPTAPGEVAALQTPWFHHLPRSLLGLPVLGDGALGGTWSPAVTACPLSLCSLSFTCLGDKVRILFHVFPPIRCKAQ